MFSIGLLALAKQLLRSAAGASALFAAAMPSSEMVDLLFLPALGLVFLAWGVYARKAGLLIPGAMLEGVGWGVYLTEWALVGGPSEAKAGVILLSLAVSWMFVPLFTGLFTDRTYWWALIPAAILGICGLGLYDDFVILNRLSEVLSLGWPLILVAAGVALIARRPLRRAIRRAEQREEG
ncbi:MAG: hypothetical protein ACYC4R_09200 [Anaerolineae bacterium]